MIVVTTTRWDTIPWKVTLAFYTNTSPVLMCTLNTRVKRGTGESHVSVMLCRRQTQVYVHDSSSCTNYLSPVERTFFLYNVNVCRMSKEKKSCLFSAMKATTKIKQVLLFKTQTVKKTRRRNPVCSLTLALTYNSPRRESK